jgi:Tol biopolymer transport system component
MYMRMKNDKWSSPLPLFVNDEVENSDDPCLNPNGDRLYFSLYDKDDNREYIYYCSRDQNGKCIPKEPEGALNTLDLHWQFSIAGSGNIYYSSNGNIYCSELHEGVYAEPYKLGESINSNLSEVTPYVSPDENMLIFSRANNGKPDLFVSYKNSTGEWLEAKSLGPEVNTDHHEMCPSLSPCGKYLFFLSSRGGLFSAYWVDAKVLNNS